MTDAVTARAAAGRVAAAGGAKPRQGGGIAATGELVALVLAAGASRRMGPGDNKLLAEVGGRPIVARVVGAFVDAGVDRVVVVLGHQADRVRAALAELSVECVVNDAWEQGMGASLAAGARAIRGRGEDTLSGVLVSVADLPGLRAAHVRSVVASPVEAAAIRVPTSGGRDGHPVLFGPAHLDTLAGLDGDRGARSILDANPERVERVELASDAILRDVDTLAALEEARRR